MKAKNRYIAEQIFRKATVAEHHWVMFSEPENYLHKEPLKVFNQKNFEWTCGRILKNISTVFLVLELY